jgi:hypothetical protein
MNLKSLLICFLLLMSIGNNVYSQVRNAQSGFMRINEKYIKVDIDHQTPLDSLISELSRDQDIHINDDSYDPGYTALIFSIASHKDSAIPLLLNLAASTKKLAVRYSVVITLNLIGVNSTITGHYTENFTNKQARVALLSMIKYPDVQRNVLNNLMKDPWQSDVPVLFKLMKQDTTAAWQIQNTLVRYAITDYPVHQPLPAWADTVKLMCPYYGTPTDPPFTTIYNVMEADMITLHNPNLHVEKHIRQIKWSVYTVPQSWKPVNKVLTLSLAAFLNEALYLDYSSLGNAFQYYVADNQLYFCSPLTTKKILLDWWDSRPESFQQSFIADKAKKPSPFLKGYIIKD